MLFEKVELRNLSENCLSKSKHMPLFDDWHGDGRGTHPPILADTKFSARSIFPYLPKYSLNVASTVCETHTNESLVPKKCLERGESGPSQLKPKQNC